MNVLFVVAHPDDEVLGGGATISKLVREGNAVDTCILNTHDVTVYKTAEEHQELLRKSAESIGVRHVYCGNYADSQMNRANHREMVEFIETAILQTQPEVIFTHHPNDINEDHRWCFQSCIEAFRIGQRQRMDIAPIRQLLLMEVLSSTDWSMDSTRAPFRPNTFVPVSGEDVVKKWESLKQYEGVLRGCPHPRRPDTIESLASLRGAQSGYPFAEAFECVFRRGL